MSNIRIVAATAILLAAPLQAQSAGAPPLHVDPTVEECEVRFASALTQKNFRRFAREFGSVSAFKQAGTPTTLGRGNASIGIEAMSFTLEDESAAWNDTFTHPNDHHPLGSRQSFPKVKLQVGVADNTRADAGWAVIAARAHRRHAIDELRLPHWPQRFRKLYCLENLISAQRYWQ
jgi:hypothetical protein